MAEPSAAEPTPEVVPTPEATPEATPANWKDAINEDVRADTGLKDINNVNDLAKGYLSSQRMLGSRILIPGEDASDIDKESFNRKLTEIPGVLKIPEEGDTQGFDELYAKLGRPETHDQYTYKSPELPEGLEESTEMSTWFKKSAHEMGASNEFVSKIMGQWDEMIISQHNQKVIAMENAESELRKDWGNEYPRHMGAARSLLQKFGSAELDEAIEASGLGNNPFFNKMMSTIAMSTLEDSAINAGLQTASETPAEIKEKINEVMNHPAYLDKDDIQHDDIVEKAFRLRQKLQTA